MADLQQTTDATPDAPQPGYSLVGKSYPRIDAANKATGQAEFTDDLDLPHMLCSVILRSSHPYARMVSIDTSRTEKAPGVKAVVTAADTPRVKFGAKADQIILAMGKVRHIGEEVAANA